MIRPLLPLLLAAALPFAAAAQAPARAFPRVVSAEGSAEVRVSPDRATVRLGVQQQAKTAQEAQKAVNGSMQKITQAVRKLGVPEKRLSTDRIELQPVYSYPREGGAEPKLVGFRASNTLRVELVLGDGPEIGRVLDVATEQGANSIEGIHFSVADDTLPRSKALEAAAVNARAKARSIAEALGGQLGELLAAQEAGVEAAHPMPNAKFALQESRAIGTPVQPGEIVISATVQVRYRLAD